MEYKYIKTHRCSKLIEKYSHVDRYVEYYNASGYTIEKGDVLVWESKKGANRLKKMKSCYSKKIKSTIEKKCQNPYLNESIKRILTGQLLVEFQTKNSTRTKLESEFKKRDIDQIYFKKLITVLNSNSIDLHSIQLEPLQKIPKLVKDADHKCLKRKFYARIRLPKELGIESLKATRLCGTIIEYVYDNISILSFNIENYYLKGDKEYKEFCRISKVDEDKDVGRCIKLIERFNDLEVSNHYDNPIVKEFIDDEIGNMQWELQQSERGQRSGVTIVNPESGQGYSKYINTYTKSTFPKYLQAIFGGKGTIKRFESAVKSGKGKYYEKIRQEAVDRLLHGYKNEHGYDYPNKKFIELIDDLKNFNPDDVPF